MLIWGLNNAILTRTLNTKRKTEQCNFVLGFGWDSLYLDIKHFIPDLNAHMESARRMTSISMHSCLLEMLPEYMFNASLE